MSLCHNDVIMLSLAAQETSSAPLAFQPNVSITFSSMSPVFVELCFFFLEYSKPGHFEPTNKIHLGRCCTSLHSTRDQTLSGFLI